MMGRMQRPALTVKQWLPEWEEVEFSAETYRRRPPDYFLLFSLEASQLRRLAGIQRRSASGPRPLDLGIQRQHDTIRSAEIAEYVHHGFPWSGLSQARRESGNYSDLKKPGWLPTAVVVNILGAEDERRGENVHEADLIDVTLGDDGTATLQLPAATDDDWRLSGQLPPLEVIDGQHRLWAFEDYVRGYEIPVVAFNRLDRSWQAYLFYTINIKPKRINSSLAFDLYPLLRTEDWLNRFDDTIYRASRAQELTEALWAHSESPWHQRIDMLGTRGQKMVTQNSWVRNLQATIIKSWDGPRSRIGGLFGAPVGGDKLVLPWSRAQQAAFLIYSWLELARTLSESSATWVRALTDESTDELPAALAGQQTMLNSDMGVRGFLYVLNDLCYVQASELRLHDWVEDIGASATSEQAVTEAIQTLRDNSIGEFIRALAQCLANYDWRSSKAEGLPEELRQAKARFRGGTGYRELRIDLLRHLANGDYSEGDERVASTAREVARLLNYEFST